MLGILNFQEEIAEWDRTKLMDEIGSLERRHKELVKILARIDPQVYVTKLQRELARLQEQNRILKSALPEPPEPSLPVEPEFENPQVEIVAELEQEEIVAHQDDDAPVAELLNQPDSSSEGHGSIDVEIDVDVIAATDADAVVKVEAEVEADAKVDVEVEAEVAIEANPDSTMQNPAFVLNSPDSTN